MSSQESQPLLVAAVREVCAALEAHAQIAAETPEDVLRVIDAGSALRDAVLKYETQLGRDTGWSNPIRHLGPLPESAADVSTPVQDGHTAAMRLRVIADYEFSIEDEELLYNFVEARGGSRPANAEEALRFLFQSDGWDVWHYPPERIRLQGFNLGIALSVSQE